MYGMSREAKKEGASSSWFLFPIIYESHSPSIEVLSTWRARETESLIHSIVIYMTSESAPKNKSKKIYTPSGHWNPMLMLSIHGERSEQTYRRVAARVTSTLPYIHLCLNIHSSSMIPEFRRYAGEGALSLIQIHRISTLPLASRGAGPRVAWRRTHAACVTPSNLMLISTRGIARRTRNTGVGTFL